jgi:hypothetical protein
MNGSGNARSEMIVFLLLISVAASSVVAQSANTPPLMSKRSIAPSTNELQGTQVTLSDRGTNFTLYLPREWTSAVASNITLCVHFHGTPWFVIQEHVRRGANEPLLVFALGEGSSTYGAPFADTNRFRRVLALTEAELQRRSGTANAHIAAVDISSFSAGYGAVRELVKSPGCFKIIRRIALLDSMYGSLEPTRNGNTNRVPLAGHIDVWLPFATAAMRGEKTFVLTHSQVPTSAYANSAECAGALLAKLGLKPWPVTTNSIAAANDPNFPLLSRADTNRLHVWSYGGTDAQAHMTHARHMADVWRVLDAAESDSQRVK